MNPKLGSKEPLFDRDKLGTQLSAWLQKPLEPNQLPITRLSMNDEGTKLKFVVDDLQYEYDLNAETLAKLGKAPPEPVFTPGPGRRQAAAWDATRTTSATTTIPTPSAATTRRKRRQIKTQTDGAQTQAGGPNRNPRDYKNFSPDRKSFVFVKKFNLYLAEADKEDAAVALTTDGVEDYSFGGGFGGGGGGRGLGTGNATATPPNPDAKLRAPAVWSSDSKSFYITRFDARGVKELFVINSLATPRPTLEKYKYPAAGRGRRSARPSFTCTSTATNKLTKVTPKWKDESYTNLHWGKTSDDLRFVRRDRLIRHFELCSLNVNTGETKCLITEGFENANVTFRPSR